MYHSYRWRSLYASGYDSIIDLAKTKLNPTGNFVEDNVAQLASLAIRIGLDFDVSRQTSRQAEEELVTSYMRVVYKVPEHRDFMYTGTPSEPILAEGSAQLLNHFLTFERDAPKVLNRAFEQGFLARGERGEMVGRLLWTLAHDKVLRDNSPCDMVQFHRPIQVIHFLKSLFHETHWDTILNARPVGMKNGPPLSEAFKDAFIHFSHFMDAGVCKITDLSQAYRLLLRGAALNCRRNQPEVDFLAPILFGLPDSTPIQLSRSSVLQAQIKNRNRTEDFLVSPTIFSSVNAHPVLSLVHELGAKEQTVDFVEGSIRITRSKAQPSEYSNPHQRHYQIVAFGCSSEVYGVIPETANYAYTTLLGSNSIDDFPHGHVAKAVEMFHELNPAYALQKARNKCEWFGEEME